MIAPLAILIDGDPAPPTGADWTLDRALHFGDGLFETLVVRQGKPLFEALHRARLAEGCRRLQIRLDSDLPWQQARQLALLHPRCTLKLLVSRGTALARGYAPSGNERARVIALAYAAPDATELPERMRVVSLRSVLGENPRLAGLKHCNRLEQVLARQELQGLDAWEGLLGSSSGQLVSGTMSNVFLELDGEWMTPALEQCGVAGVMRSVVLREAGECGLHIRTEALPLAVLQRCSAMFLTNARIGVRMVHALDGRALREVARVARLTSRVRDLED